MDNEYPFEEGDTYYHLARDFEIIESCWDEFSREAYDDNPELPLYPTREGACITLSDIARNLVLRLNDVVGCAEATQEAHQNASADLEAIAIGRLPRFRGIDD